MDANLKIVLDQYFEGAAKLKPNVFVPVRDNRVQEPLIDASFSESEPSTLIMPDYQEIFEGDILVYPKTRQFCYVDDIRHTPSTTIRNISVKLTRSLMKTDEPTRRVLSAH